MYLLRVLALSCVCGAWTLANPTTEKQSGSGWCHTSWWPERCGLVADGNCIGSEYPPGGFPTEMECYTVYPPITLPLDGWCHTSWWPRACGLLSEGNCIANEYPIGGYASENECMTASWGTVTTATTTTTTTTTTTGSFTPTPSPTATEFLNGWCHESWNPPSCGLVSNGGCIGFEYPPGGFATEAECLNLGLPSATPTPTVATGWCHTAWYPAACARISRGLCIANEYPAGGYPSWDACVGATSTLKASSNLPALEELEFALGAPQFVQTLDAVGLGEPRLNAQGEALLTLEMTTKNNHQLAVTKLENLGSTIISSSEELRLLVAEVRARSLNEVNHIAEIDDIEPSRQFVWAQGGFSLNANIPELGNCTDPGAGVGSNVYIIDCPADFTHEAFTGIQTETYYNGNTVSNPSPCEHGTMVASMVASLLPGSSISTIGPRQNLEASKAWSSNLVNQMIKMQDKVEAGVLLIPGGTHSYPHSASQDITTANSQSPFCKAISDFPIPVVTSAGNSGSKGCYNSCTKLRPGESCTREFVSTSTSFLMQFSFSKDTQLRIAFDTSAGSPVLETTAELGNAPKKAGTVLAGFSAATDNKAYSNELTAIVTNGAPFEGTHTVQITNIGPFPTTAHMWITLCSEETHFTDTSEDKFSIWSPCSCEDSICVGETVFENNWDANSGSFCSSSDPSITYDGASCADSAGRVTKTSSRGPVFGTQGLKPDLVAPGLGSVVAQLGGGYSLASGTSLSAARVAAGVAAHVAKSATPLASLNSATIRESVMATTKHDPKVDALKVEIRGAGVFDMYNLLEACGSCVEVEPTDVSVEACAGNACEHGTWISNGYNSKYTCRGVTSITAKSRLTNGKFHRTYSWVHPTGETLPAGTFGQWEVFISFLECSGRTVEYTVHAADGDVTVLVDQSQDAGVWKSLGVFAFTTTVSLELDSYIADDRTGTEIVSAARARFIRRGTIC